MDNTMFALVTVMTMVVIGYIVFYIKTRRYASESFEDEKKSSSYVVFDSKDIPEKPYMEQQINSVDDYEYNVVFQNEGTREASKELQNKLASQYPMDWTQLPPNSAAFQEGQKAHASVAAVGVEAFKNQLDSPYKEMESGYQPPDLDAIDEEEKKILATYVPTKSTTPGKYDLEDAKDLITKIYEKRGLVPEIVEKPNNVYEVVGTQEINPKIVWEDQAPVQHGGAAPQSVAGENTIVVPYSAGDPDKALDPYFDKTASTRNGRWDYRQWTPGLERMFAPTQPQTAWY